MEEQAILKDIIFMILHGGAIILAVFLLYFVMYSSTTEGSHVLMYLLQIDCIILVAQRKFLISPCPTNH